MNTHEAKQAARKARLEARAARLDELAHATLGEARQMAGAIPFGQPILVGHHSEKRDRNYREKIGRKFDKSLELHKAAEATARRAEGVGTGGISSDDPDAPDKIRARIDALECAHARMIEFNAGWRKAGRPDPDDQDGWKRVADVLGRSDDDLLRVRLDMSRRRTYGQGRQPFEAWAISNSGANIKRLKGRLAQLARRAEAATAQPEVEREVDGVRVVENLADNRLQLFFPDKPDATVRTALKRAGFRWAPSVGAWQAHLSTNAKWRASDVLGARL